MSCLSPLAMPTSPLLTLLPGIPARSEVESQLLHLTTLHSSYARILRTLPPSSHSSSEELAYALAELKATLAAIELDADELDESVQAVAEPGVAARLGISRAEVAERRTFLERVKREIAVSWAGLWAGLVELCGAGC